MTSFGYGALIFLALLISSSTVLSDRRQLFKEFLSGASRQPENGKSVTYSDDPPINGTRWAVLVAGSNGYDNYRHQADICHAYQILRKGGLMDENIVVFMYDDIAFHVCNPRPGIIINKPDGEDVYFGVPKDYTGEACTAHNFFQVLLGNKSAVEGGSGKVVESSPDDYIFVYYADHGGPGIVEMPAGGDLYAKDLIETLKKKHASKSYKKLVFYMEACESGSMFDGLLPDNLNIYAVTASNPNESSYGYYCPGDLSSSSNDYDTCLGDLFSISWMEDSDIHDARKETLEKQYEVARRRTGDDNLEAISHVMKYGDLTISEDLLYLYQGRNPANDKFTTDSTNKIATATSSTNTVVVDQRDADLFHLKYKYNKAAEGSTKKTRAQEKLMNLFAQRNHVDTAITQIAKVIFGEPKLDSILKLVRPQGQPLVDDWDCLKSMVRMFEKYCGQLGTYGKRYTRAMANMCNAGATVEEMGEAAAAVCSNLAPPPATPSGPRGDC